MLHVRHGDAVQRGQQCRVRGDVAQHARQGQPDGSLRVSNANLAPEALGQGGERDAGGVCVPQDQGGKRADVVVAGYPHVGVVAGAVATQEADIVARL